MGSPWKTLLQAVVFSATCNCVELWHFVPCCSEWGFFDSGRENRRGICGIQNRAPFLARLDYRGSQFMGLLGQSGADKTDFRPGNGRKKGNDAQGFCGFPP
jgi:hypothetical protein